jgi:hypothetical protein
MTKATKATTAPAIKLIVGQKLIEAGLVAFNKRATALQNEAHVLCCSVLAHVGKHSDIRLVGALLSAMPDMARRNAIRDWFVAFGPVTFENDAPVFVKGGKTLLGDAMAKPFWSFSPEKPYEAMDVAKVLSSLVKKLEKDGKETKRDHSSIINVLSKIDAKSLPAA